MGKKNYELTINGLNTAISDFSRTNWESQTFHVIDNLNIIGFEDVQVFVQNAFNGAGDYKYQGNVRPKICDDNGYYVKNMTINGTAHIEIVNNEIIVDSIRKPISIN